METTDAFLDRCISGEARVPTAAPTGGPVTRLPEPSTGSTESVVPAAATTSTSTELPLAKARIRLARREARKRQPRPEKGPPPLKAAFLGHVAAMRAEGFPIRAIATGLRCSDSSVQVALRMPETQLEIAKRRELSKQIASQSLPSVVSKGFALAESAADEGDAKSFDAATRGLHALEKIGASVSGEDRKMSVEHSGAIETTPSNAVEELKILIGVVTGQR